MPRGAEGRWQGWSRWAARLAVGVLCLPAPGLPATGGAWAEEAAPAREAASAPVPQVEAWGSGSLSDRWWDISSGMAFAPFGSVLEDGLRIRLQGGGGRYSYDTLLPTEDGWAAREVEGLTTRTDALVGYQLGQPGLTAKLYLGARQVAHRLWPDDPGNHVAGERLGGLVLAEVWLEPAPLLWAALDASYGTAFGEHNLTLAAGYRLLPGLSGGLELGLGGDEGYEAGKAGLLVEADTPLGQVRLTGGLAGARLEASEPYLSLGLWQRF